LEPALSPATSTWLEGLGFDWGDLVVGRRLRALRKNECLFAQGQADAHVYIVHSGRVRLTIHDHEGSELHVAIVGSTGLLGDTGASAFGSHLCSAYASAQSSVYVLPRQALLEGIARHPAWLRQSRAMADHLMRLSLQHHWLLGVQGARQRVCHHLLGLLASHGQAHPRGRLIGITFSQQEMAELCCISRVSVSHVWRELEREGVIEREGRLLLVRELAALAHKAR
jgi:CRP-like cAMP-binding protein